MNAPAAEQIEPPSVLVLPVLNVTLEIPLEIPVPLSEHIRLQPVTGDHLVTITQDEPGSGQYLRGGVYTLAVEDQRLLGDDPALEVNVLCAIFAINIFASTGGLAIDRAFVLTKDDRYRVSSVKYLSSLATNPSCALKFPEEVDFGDAAEVFAAALDGMAKHPPMRTTVWRYCNAVGRGSTHDKVIDLCISLESIFEASTEISFQFALYNSLLSEDDFDKRCAVFDLLKKLYNQRSKIVHGGDGVDDAWIEEHWPTFVAIAKASILRKLKYVSSQNPSHWRIYLRELALGMNENAQAAQDAA